MVRSQPDPPAPSPSGPVPAGATAAPGPGPAPPAPLRSSLPLGRVAGITIRVHVTFTVLVVLVAVGAAAAGRPVLPAVGWLLALFACVVAHELAHSLVARRRGVVVTEIDLLPIGGVSRLEAIPERWRDEAAIALAGPLASLALAGVAAAVAVAAGVPLVPIDLLEGAVLARLAWVNVLLAAFNLLPAFPLDGGRVLRAVLERRLPRTEATRRAARAGRVLAGALVVAGLLVDVWLVLIGVFVWWAGRAEERAALAHAVLGPVPVDRLALPCPLVLAAEARVADVLARCRATPQVGYPVADGDRVIGVATIGALDAAPCGARVSTLATGAVVASGASLEDAARAMEQGGAVVVVDATGAPKGVLAPEMVVGYLRQAAG